MAVFLFGPFRLDTRTQRLTRGEDVVPVAARHADVLGALLARTGHTVPKDVLVEAAWKDVAVTDNSLEQAISALRRALGPPRPGAPDIETVPRQGYRFVGDVRREASRETDAQLEVLVAPHRAWVNGRAALEALDATRVEEARAAFERVVAQSPDWTPGRIGLANACLWRFEATRASDTPDDRALEQAHQHAREACRLDPHSGEAWATLGVVLDRLGQTEDAQAAVARAAALEPDNWRHHFRLSLVHWGEARLRAARRTLVLLPGLPLAHWLAATVLVARQAFDDAEQELRSGLEAMRASSADGHARFPGVALSWLLGLVRLAQGDEAQAMAQFADELDERRPSHLYAAEARANAWYARGAVHLRHGRTVDATEAFERACALAPRHPASAALHMVRRQTGASPGSAVVGDASGGPRDGGSPVDLALVHAVSCAMAGQDDAAVALVADALAQARPGPQAWWLPVEPVLRPYAHTARWAPVLALLRARAS